MKASESITAADILYDLRLTVTTVDELPASLRPSDLNLGYAIQNELVGRLESHYGGSRIGYKIACTNTHAQLLLNTSAPVFGRLSSCFTRSSPAKINGKGFSLLGIEPEFAFEIGKDVPTLDTPHSAETIVDYVASVIPAIELVGHRFSDWSKFDAPTLVADNAVHQAWIPGATVDKWRDLDFAGHPVELMVNGKVALKGTDANVLGNPLNALAWLANELPRWDQPLRAGEVVTTGTCTDVYIAQIGDEIRADFGDLGSVQLELT
ncbi:MAG: fumarylacetoacetate hydrolase family protein [Gammaproteobacteria bacterium]|nr:fumarylacetoacetate hydrolase family protein [Gammaproteobacteria bacterium]